MSYAGPASRSRGSAGRRDPAAAAPSRPIGAAGPAPIRRPSAPSTDSDEGDHETDWQRVAIFGVGLAIGLTLGAGAALLAAPQTGEETRAALRSRARRLTRATGRRSQDAWDGSARRAPIGGAIRPPAPSQAGGPQGAAAGARARDGGGLGGLRDAGCGMRLTALRDHRFTRSASTAYRIPHNRITASTHRSDLSSSVASVW